MAGIFTKQGDSGLQRFDGYHINDELASLKIYNQQKLIKQMIFTDSTVSACLKIYNTLLSKVKTELQPIDESSEAMKAKEFIDECINDLHTPFKTSLSSFYSFIPWGWSWHEILYKRRKGWNKNRKESSKYQDNLIGWRDFAVRSQDSLHKFGFANDGDAITLIQLGGEDSQEYSVSREKSIYLRTLTHNNSPSGFSALYGSAKDYLLKCQNQKSEQGGVRRDVTGTTKIGLPEEYFDAKAETAVKEKKKAFDKLLQGIDSGEVAGFTLPNVFNEKGNPLFTVEAIGLQGRKAYDVNPIINRYDQAIARSLLADFIFLGFSANGTYELGKGKMTLLFESLENYLDTVCDEFNSAIERLMILNEMDTTFCPKLSHGKVNELDLTELTPLLQLLVSIGVKFTEQEIEWIKSLAMPVFDSKK